MRSGKSIWIIAGGIFVAWLLEPAWEWAFYRFLDSAARTKGGVLATIGRVIAMTAPAHGFLLGVSIGMLLALTIGYWDQIVWRGRYWLEWFLGALWLLGRSASRQKLHAGGAHLFAGEVSKAIDLSDGPVQVWKSEVKWWPTEPVVCHLYQDQMGIYRHDRSPNSPAITVSYEIWGRQYFRKTIQNWRKTDHIRKVLEFKAMKRAEAKAATHSRPELPELEP